MNNLQRNKIRDKAFKYFGVTCTFFGIFILGVFLFGIINDGVSRINWDFLTNLPSYRPKRAGILTAWTGTLWIFGLTAIIAIPLGIAAAIYLEEYGKKSWFANLLEINITNLAGVPSIIYGILGLEIFVRLAGLGGSLLAGSFTLSLLILPVIIVATREALKAVPLTTRTASYALGATKWQTIWNLILPASLSSIITGIILALARAVGETAPLIVIGALAYVPFVAKTPMDEFTVMPIQIFNWISRPQHGFTINAAAAIIILLAFVFVMNGIAVYIRIKAKKKSH
ncbi:MAG: phosphate ABC transporter permease PstA [Bacteroidia bacterium]|jgi:phosphate transport system permease protein|nr:phosphate ABC transporter permease PstA [Bacteroidia bacterium]